MIKLASMGNPDVSGIQISPGVEVTNVDAEMAKFKKANRTERAGTILTAALIAAMSTGVGFGIAHALNNRSSDNAGFLGVKYLEGTDPLVPEILNRLSKK